MMSDESYDSGYLAGWSDGREELLNKVRCGVFGMIDRLDVVSEANIDVVVCLQDLIKELGLK